MKTGLIGTGVGTTATAVVDSKAVGSSTRGNRLISAHLFVLHCQSSLTVFIVNQKDILLEEDLDEILEKVFALSTYRVHFNPLDAHQDTSIQRIFTALD